LSSFGDHRRTRKLFSQVIPEVWSCTVPDRRVRNRPGICFERKLSFHRRVRGSGNRHPDRSEGETTHWTLYWNHAGEREFSQHFYAAHPSHYLRHGWFFSAGGHIY